VKVALVSPLPPANTGIADYTLDVARALSARHQIDLFSQASEVPPPAEILRFDAVIHQIGNGPAHDFQYAWLECAPGIVVLHDLVLHHARSRLYLVSEAARAYERDPSNAGKRDHAMAAIDRYVFEADAAYPGQGERLRDAHLNTSGDLLLFAYPFFQEALRHARAVGAHNDFMVEALVEARPDLKVRRVAMPVEPLAVTADEVSRLRNRYGIADDAFVVGCFGLVTKEKRIEAVARAVRRLRPHIAGLRLLLVGAEADPAWVTSALAAAGVLDITVRAGRVPLEALGGHLELASVVAHLRYPTARETSAALLRALAQERPTIISDLDNQREIPKDAVFRVDPTDEEGGLARNILAAAQVPRHALEVAERGARFVRDAHSFGEALRTYEALIDAARAP
jgi:glycosyltransferase involved in cell wall biosynthesis